MIRGYAHVVCDILHPGHIEFLKKCKEACDYLIVGVLGSNAAAVKGKRPIMSVVERMAIVGAIKYVDEVTVQKEWNPAVTCREVAPDILFESEAQTDQPANEFVIEQGGIVLQIPYTQGISSTKIKERLRDLDNSERAY